MKYVPLNWNELALTLYFWLGVVLVFSLEARSGSQFAESNQFWLAHMRRPAPPDRPFDTSSKFDPARFAAAMPSFTSFMEYVLKLPNASTPNEPAAASDGTAARANRESATRQALDLCMTLLL